MRSVASVGWTPKSALIASSISVRWPITIAAIDPTSVRRSSNDGNGSARNAVRWRPTISSSSAIASASSDIVAVRFSVSAISSPLDRGAIEHYAAPGRRGCDLAADSHVADHTQGEHVVEVLEEEIGDLGIEVGSPSLADQLDRFGNGQRRAVGPIAQ